MALTRRETTTSAASLAGRIRLFVFGFFAGMLFHKNYSTTKFSLQMLEMSKSVLELQLASSKVIIRNSKDDSSSREKEGVAVAVAIVEEDDMSSDSEIQPFTKQPGVIFVTKIHGSGQMDQLKQSLCLLNAAYNRRMKYNVLVFVTEPLTDEDIRDLRSIVYPAHLDVENEEVTLEQHLGTLNAKQTEMLLQHCGVQSKSELSWDTSCCDDRKSRKQDGESSSSSSCMPLRLDWHSEFRSMHIWYHQALAPYQWMVWLDSDVMMTQVWQQDPVVFAIQNQAHILFAQFTSQQQYTSSTLSSVIASNDQKTDAHHQQLAEKVTEVYGADKKLCRIWLVNGQLQPEFDDGDGGNCMLSENASTGGGGAAIGMDLIDGYFHITNLDFYRSEQNEEWYNAMIGSAWGNDQVAVTIPAVLQEPEKAMDLKSHGMHLHLWHKGMIDNEQWDTNGVQGFKQWFGNRSAIDFPQAAESCQKFIKDPAL